MATYEESLAGLDEKEKDFVIMLTCYSRGDERFHEYALGKSGLFPSKPTNLKRLEALERKGFLVRLKNKSGKRGRSYGHYYEPAFPLEKSLLDLASGKAAQSSLFDEERILLERMARERILGYFNLESNLGGKASLLGLRNYIIILLADPSNCLGYFPAFELWFDDGEVGHVAEYCIYRLFEMTAFEDLGKALDAQPALAAISNKEVARLDCVRALLELDDAVYRGFFSKPRQTRKAEALAHIRATPGHAIKSYLGEAAWEKRLEERLEALRGSLLKHYRKELATYRFEIKRLGALVGDMAD
jgi:hypothetical protein